MAEKTAQEFIEIWNTSATVEEAARRARAKVGTAKVRASRYRLRGIHMKSMRLEGGAKRGEDWEALAKFSEQFSGDEFS